LSLSPLPRKGAIKVCVAVKIDTDSVKVRDTKDVKSPTLTFTHAEWDAFIGGVKLGEFDLPAKLTMVA
jgi:hypothetical protein